MLVAQAAAEVVADHRHEFDATIQQIRQERERLAAGLAAIDGVIRVRALRR